MYIQAVRYPLAVLYRFLIAFVIGYLCTYFFSLNLTELFARYLPKAESIYLAAFSAIFFYLIFVIMSFCIESLKKLSIVCTSILLVLFLFSKWIG